MSGHTGDCNRMAEAHWRPACASDRHPALRVNVIEGRPWRGGLPAEAEACLESDETRGDEHGMHGHTVGRPYS